MIKVFMYICKKKHIIYIMKTNQVMIREIGFKQRTIDSYFNANELLSTYNELLPKNKSKDLGDFQRIKETKEFIEQLKKEGIEHPYIASKGKGINQGTWMHPKLFIDFAMWLSVEFKSKVIDMVLDGLIVSRNDAGDYYKEMCATIMDVYIETHGCKPNPMIYINEANRIKELVNPKDRNELSEQELKQITYLQKVNSMLIRKKIGKESRIKRLIEANEVNI